MIRLALLQALVFLSANAIYGGVDLSTGWAPGSLTSTSLSNPFSKHPLLSHPQSLPSLDQFQQLAKCASDCIARNDISKQCCKETCDNNQQILFCEASIISAREFVSGYKEGFSKGYYEGHSSGTQEGFTQAYLGYDDKETPEVENSPAEIEDSGIEDDFEGVDPYFTVTDDTQGTNDVIDDAEEAVYEVPDSNEYVFNTPIPAEELPEYVIEEAESYDDDESDLPVYDDDVIFVDDDVKEEGLTDEEYEEYQDTIEEIEAELDDLVGQLEEYYDDGDVMADDDLSFSEEDEADEPELTMYDLDPYEVLYPDRVQNEGKDEEYDESYEEIDGEKYEFDDDDEEEDSPEPVYENLLEDFESFLDSLSETEGAEDEGEYYEDYDSEIDEVEEINEVPQPEEPNPFASIVSDVKKWFSDFLSTAPKRHAKRSSRTRSNMEDQGDELDGFPALKNDVITKTRMLLNPKYRSQHDNLQRELMIIKFQLIEQIKSKAFKMGFQKGYVDGKQKGWDEGVQDGIEGFSQEQVGLGGASPSFRDPFQMIF